MLVDIHILRFNMPRFLSQALKSRKQPQEVQGTCDMLKRLPGCYWALALLLLACIGEAAAAVTVEYISEGTCQPSQQRSIIDAVTGCQARETLMDLRQHLPNMSDVIQVIPDFAAVRRCGGSCSRNSHRCVPTAARRRRLDVMLVLSQLPRTETETRCGHVEVEEHVGCRCDCPVQPRDCRPADQYFEPASCRCLCSDQAARNACIGRGMQWDPVNCMCVCPTTSWRVCSTGYIFDFSQTCRCVPTSTTASTGLVAAIVVLSTCMLVSLVGGYVMHKKQVGLFRQTSRKNKAAAVKAAAAVAGAKNLKSEYDLVKETG